LRFISKRGETAPQVFTKSDPAFHNPFEPLLKIVRVFDLPPLSSAEHCRICQCKRWAMFELSRLIARESEFRPSPDKSEARRGVFRSFTAKNRGTGVAFFWLLFLAKQEK
jgi:hypothetical protein